MASLLDAINAVAAQLQGNENQSAQSARVQPRVQPKVQPKVQLKSANAEVKNEAAPKVQPKATNGAKAKEPKSQPKKDTPKTKGVANYVIPAEFKQAIETYLKSRPDMKDKLNAEGKSLDGCCDYIFDVMRKRAEKNRGGKSAVGLYAPPEEIFGLAVHYYDESNESLKSEKH